MKTVFIIGERTGKTDALFQALREFREAGVTIGIAGEEFMQKFSKELENASQTLEKALPNIEVMNPVYFDGKKHQPPHQRRKRNGK